jgi:hypothetical protein
MCIKKKPKEVWNIIRKCSNTQRSKVDVSLDELYEYFKDLNFSDDNEIDHDNKFVETNVDVADRILNSHISASEIEETVRKLPNGKVAGIECIKNEYIKNTIRLMLPVYEKIFNIILNTGIVPEAWTVGSIHPIYKSKGDSKDPSNYRPISLVSCYSKVFTSIINNRLASYCDVIKLFLRDLREVIKNTSASFTYVLIKINVKHKTNPHIL